MASQLVQMVTVVDKSGKAVNSVSSYHHWLEKHNSNRDWIQSKHIVGVWKEARAAYKERKAEVVASRVGSPLSPGSPRTLGPASPRDDRSHASSRGHRSHRHGRRHSHDSERRSSPGSPRTAPVSPSSGYATPLASPLLDRRSSTPSTPTIKRSFTDKDQSLQLMRPPPPPRSYTTPSTQTIDMDLAYGDLPGSLPLSTRGQEEEVKGLVSTINRLLEEADCLHHSATKTIAMLQKNPDAMAAVALALAELSAVAKKMAPTALANVSRGAPAVFSLLASPQFLIAGGVAVGLTIVAFGGFKVIKKIKAQQAKEDPGMDEMLEVGTDVSRIETWRRGIAEEQASAIESSVDGELITPQAAALSRLNLGESRRSEISNKHSRRHHSSEKSARSSSRSESKASSKAHSQADSTVSSKHSTSSAKGKDSRAKSVKKPSPLRLMFS